MDILLTPTLENFVKEKVAAGLYSNASEVMQEALQLLLKKEQSQQLLNDELDKGYDAYKTGKYEEYSPNMLRKIADEVVAKKNTE